MGLSIIDKLKLLAKLNTAANAVQEGMKMKDSTKVILAVLGCITGILQIPSIQAAVVSAIAAHPAIALILGSITPILTLLHVPSNQPGNSGGNITPIIILVLAFGMLAPARVQAQSLPTAPADGNNIYGVGASYSVNSKPGVAGSLLYARAMLPDSKTWAFTHADFVPNSMKPFTVTNNIGAGLAQNVVTFGKVPIFCVTGAGVSWTGVNTGFQFNGGCLAAIQVKGLLFMPAGRFFKSSVSNGTGYQPIIGAYIGKRW